MNASHDLVLMSLRRTILEVEAKRENWIPFLRGFGIVKVDDSYQWFETGKLTDVKFNQGRLVS